VPSSARPQVALVHDYLTQRGGAERVVADLATTFPEAPLFTSLFEPSLTYPEFQQLNITSSKLNQFSLFRHHHRLALPLYASVFSRCTIDADVAICSSSGWAHGVHVTGAKLVYCHAPARWLYQRDRYLRESGAAQRVGLAPLAPWLRRWDQNAAHSADAYVVNSTATLTMVREIYGLDATVIHPPISIDTAGEQRNPGNCEPGFLLVVARLLSYKNVHLTLHAAALSRTPVVVVGDGPLRSQLERHSGTNVSFLGTVDDATLRWCYANCLAHVAMSYEDYGLSPIEAAAFGKPTLALGQGGYLDTVDHGRTGLHVAAATVEALKTSLSEFSQMTFQRDEIIRHANTFSKERFSQAMQAEVAALLR